jgi:HSP20 family molecular chaperone IbpA
MQRGQVYERREQEEPMRRGMEYERNPSRRYLEDDECRAYRCPCAVEIVRPEIFSTKRNNATMNNLWTLETDVEDFTVDEIKIKVDQVFHTLCISGKRPIHRRREENCRNVFKRVVPLPENVDIRQLNTVMTVEGKLLLTAPFCYNIRDETISTTRIPITLKDNVNYLPNMTLDELKTQSPVSQFLRLLKSFTFPGVMSADCVKDEITSGYKLTMDFDTVGFRPQEIQVTFMEKERRFIVNAKHEVAGVGNNVFRHEFLLPEYLNADQMQYRVLNNGILRIQMPCEYHQAKETNKGIKLIRRQ